MRQYWTEREEIALLQAKNEHDLRHIAFAVLERMPKPISMVCGPISTGGEGSKEKNIIVFKKTIEILVKKDVIVFDQTIFEDDMHKLRPQDDYHWDLLHHFYGPILKSGLISRLYFIWGWYSSIGAKWEHNTARREEGIEIIHLAHDWHLYN